MKNLETCLYLIEKHKLNNNFPTMYYDLLVLKENEDIIKQKVPLRVQFFYDLLLKSSNAIIKKTYEKENGKTEYNLEKCYSVLNNLAKSSFKIKKYIKE